MRAFEFENQVSEVATKILPVLSSKSLKVNEDLNESPKSD
jgi:hypothetical protein